MSQGPKPSRSVRRQRQANEPGGRPHRHLVSLTDSEEAQLRGRAHELDITVPRLLVEAALASEAKTPAVRQQQIARLFAELRRLNTMAVDLKALARLGAAQGASPAGTADAIQEIRKAVAKLNATLDDVARS